MVFSYVCSSSTDAQSVSDMMEIIQEMVVDLYLT